MRDRSQIDYVGFSGGDGVAYAAREGDLRDNEVLYKGMDHRLLVASIQLAKQVSVSLWSRSNLKRWSPASDKIQVFLDQVTSPDFLQLSLGAMEAKLVELTRDAWCNAGQSGANPEHSSSNHSPSNKEAFRSRRA